MNPVSQSLKALLLELLIQLTNFHSDVNGHKNTSMYYLCSNFRQINNNVVTVKNDVACTTTISYMQSFSIITQGLKEVIMNLNH